MVSASVTNLKGFTTVYPMAPVPFARMYTETAQTAPPTVYKPTVSSAYPANISTKQQLPASLAPTMASIAQFAITSPALSVFQLPSPSTTPSVYATPTPRSSSIPPVTPSHVHLAQVLSLIARPALTLQETSPVRIAQAGSTWTQIVPVLLATLTAQIALPQFATTVRPPFN